MTPSVTIRLSLAMCATLLLAACATQPVTPSAPWAQQAQTQAQAGHPAAAAAIYLRAAPSLPSPQREQIMLKAAALLLQAQQPEQARTVIEHINPQDLSSDDTGRRAGLAAQVALAEHQPAQALAALPTSTTGLSNPVAAELLELRAQAERLNDNPLGAVEARIARAPLLAETSALDANRKSLWELLSQASPQQTRQWLQQATTPPLKGWLALALIAKSTPPQPAALAAALANWQQQYNLPDATPIIEALKAQWQAMQVYPPRIAILLPLTGRFAPVSTAILDGLLTAYYRHPSQPDAQPITLRFYDTSAHPQNIPALYARAVRDGAQYVIGPLDRNAVTELAQSGAVSVPTLALNHAADGTQIPAKLYQFGLIPESEAAQAAERASLDGYSRAVALTPNSDWGKRVAAAFSNRFTQLGGQVLATGRYDPTASDFTPAIVNSLNIDYSDARRRAVAATIGQSVEFEARRRQDVDMIFIVGDPRQARLLIPQIRFHHGIGLPIYSISTAYSGTHDPRADHDLNGMIFDDAPLLLDAQGPAAAARDAMHTNFPDASRRYPRLIALGEDAFDVLPYLGRLASEDWARFPGLSGSLKMTPGNVLVRQLEWAQFDNGLPVPFGQVGTSNTVPTATPAQQNADTPP